jgi:hypothetical protein
MWLLKQVFARGRSGFQRKTLSSTPIADKDSTLDDIPCHEEITGLGNIILVLPHGQKS